jgi:hypothetical protein
MSFRSSPFLRQALLADAVATGATGLLLATSAGSLEPLLALPVPLARWAGLALLPWAAFVLRLGRSEEPDRSAVVSVIAGNAIWAAASVALAVSGWIALTALGTAFVVLQALVVAGFAEAQWIGLRRSAVPALS